MGVVKEKSETSIIMDEDEFNRSIEPILSKKEKVYFAPPDRDPRFINAHLKVSFDDVIAEPSSTHSFDKIWIGSHAVFELTKYVLYKTLTAVLAIPLAIVAGILFGILSCIHIWVAMPLVKGYMVVLPSIQLVWRSLTDTFVAPLFNSMGRCLSSVQLATTQN